MNLKTNNLSNATIFVIDDEKVATDVIRLYLEQGGCRNIHGFNNSVEAMETLAFVKPDVVITDVEMPELGGKYLTRLIKKTSHLEQIPIIVVTSDASDATRKKLIGNGVDEILIKPTSADELLRAIERSTNRDDTDQAAPDNLADGNRQASRLSINASME